MAPQLAASLEECKATWPGRVVLYSNSAGLQEFDPDGGLPSVRAPMHVGMHTP